MGENHNYPNEIHRAKEANTNACIENNILNLNIQQQKKAKTMHALLITAYFWNEDNIEGVCSMKGMLLGTRNMLLCYLGITILPYCILPHSSLCFG